MSGRFQCRNDCIFNHFYAMLLSCFCQIKFDNIRIHWKLINVSSFIKQFFSIKSWYFTYSTWRCIDMISEINIWLTISHTMSLWRQTRMCTPMTSWMDVLVIGKGIDTSWWVRVMFQGDMSRNRDGRRSKEDNEVHNRYRFMIRCGPQTLISLIYSTLTGIKSNHCGGERLPSCHGTSPSAPYVVWCSNREQTYRISMANLSFSIKLILEKDSPYKCWWLKQALTVVKVKRWQWIQMHGCLVL